MAQTCPVFAFDNTIASTVKEARSEALSKLASALKNACEPTAMVLDGADFTEPTLVSIDMALEEMNAATVVLNNALVPAEEESALQRLAETALYVADAFTVVADEVDMSTEFTEYALKAAEAFTNVSEAAEEAAVLAADVAEFQ
jgi:hypothetical protein